jgi:hypothetical protein
VREAFGDEGCNRFMAALSRAMAAAGGAKYDTARPHGLTSDEFWNHGETEAELIKYWAKVERLAKRVIISKPAEGEGGRRTYIEGVQFEYGIGKDFDLAEDNLTERKSKRAKPQLVTVTEAEYERRFPCSSILREIYWPAIKVSDSGSTSSNLRNRNRWFSVKK